MLTICKLFTYIAKVNLKEKKKQNQKAITGELNPRHATQQGRIKPPIPTDTYFEFMHFQKIYT